MFRNHLHVLLLHFILLCNCITSFTHVDTPSDFHEAVFHVELSSPLYKPLLQPLYSQLTPLISSRQISLEAPQLHNNVYILEIYAFTPTAFQSLPNIISSLSFPFSIKDIRLKPSSTHTRASRYVSDCSTIRETYKSDNTSMGLYHDTDELTTFLHQTVQTYPSLASLSLLGHSNENRPIYSLLLTSSNSSALSPSSTFKPAIKYIGNIHGDETVSREILIRLISYLCSEYTSQTNPYVTSLLNSIRLFIVPTMNPDGFELGTRANSHNIDLNRDFPDQYQDDINSAKGRQIETTTIMQWSEEETFVLSISFHGGSLVANYPFDGTKTAAVDSSGIESKTPDNEEFISLAKSYAEKHSSMSNSREFTSGITNGADWYVLYGGMQDWNYVYYGDFELTIELGNIKCPKDSDLDKYFLANKNALVGYLGNVWKGVYGVVVDENGERVKLDGTRSTKIYVEELNEGKGKGKRMFPVYAHKDTGEYWRILKEGKYKIWAEIEISNGKNIKSDVNEVDVSDSLWVDGNFGELKMGERVDLRMISSYEYGQSVGDNGSGVIRDVGSLILLIGVAVLTLGIIISLAVMWYKKYRSWERNHTLGGLNEDDDHLSLQELGIRLDNSNDGDAAERVRLGDDIEMEHLSGSVNNDNNNNNNNNISFDDDGDDVPLT